MSLIPKDGILKEPLHATDEETLELVSELLHDEFFEFDKIGFGKELHIVTIPVRRMHHSGPKRMIKDGIFWKTYEKDWMHSIVTIRGVNTWDILEDKRIDCYSFQSWKYTKGKIEVECVDMFLKFTVDCIDVEINDIGFKGKARLKIHGETTGSYTEGYSGRVY